MDQLKPYQPSLREKLSWGIADALSSTRYGKQDLAKALGTTLDFVPGVGTALAANDTARSVKEGDKTDTALNLAGFIPGFAPIKRALGVGLDHLPPYVRAFHGTGSSKDFDAPKWVPDSGDLGLHVALNPETAFRYVPPPNEFGNKPRIYPVAADIRNPLGHDPDIEIEDAMNWSDPEMVLRSMQDIRHDRKYNKVWEDIDRAANTPGRGWDRNFPEALRKHGYDSVLYNHEGQRNEQALMLLDDAQALPQFSDRINPTRGILDTAGKRGEKVPRLEDRNIGVRYMWENAVNPPLSVIDALKELGL